MTIRGLCANASVICSTPGSIMNLRSSARRAYRNFPLLAGHGHKQSQLLNEAVDDYTRAVEKDPKMVDAYVNRGYVLNDLQNANAASKDFQSALQLNPKNGVAHLGMAF